MDSGDAERVPSFPEEEEEAPVFLVAENCS